MKPMLLYYPFSSNDERYINRFKKWAADSVTKSKLLFRESYQKDNMLKYAT